MAVKDRRLGINITISKVVQTADGRASGRPNNALSCLGTAELPAMHLFSAFKMH